MIENSGITRVTATGSGTFISLVRTMLKRELPFSMVGVESRLSQGLLLPVGFRASFPSLLFFFLCVYVCCGHCAD